MVTDAERAEEFLKAEFQKHPHYSFNDWRIMYEHGLTVRKIALQIAKSVSCDAAVVELGAILHDIGKTVEADEETLRQHHEELGYEVCEPLLDSLRITPEQHQKLRLIFIEGDTIEKQVIKDADIIAFLADAQLQRALLAWAQRRGIAHELERKLRKAQKLRFPLSKALAMPLIEETKRRWKMA